MGNTRLQFAQNFPDHPGIRISEGPLYCSHEPPTALDTMADWLAEHILT
jgi:hypothetical protein